MRTESLTHTFTARLPLLVPSCRSLISCTCNVTTDPVSLRVCVCFYHTLMHKGREQRATIILWVWDNSRAVQTWCEGLWGEWYGHTHTHTTCWPGKQRASQAQRSGEFTGHHSWQPLLGRGLVPQCQGWVPTCRSFQMPQQRVCLAVCTNTHSHTMFWEWMCIIRRIFFFLSGNHNRRLYIKMSKTMSL